jgi:putative phosphoribosyl transferase
MEAIIRPLWQDREQAGLLLSKKLNAFKGSNAIVIGIPYGGVCVAAVIAEALSLPLEVIACRKIPHPADSKRNIGSVSAHEVLMHDCSHTIPQDYVYHQIALIRNAIQYEWNFYYGKDSPASLTNKTVILVDDILKSADSMLACLREIQKQEPLQVIVVVPVVSADAARIVRSEADDIVFLRLEPVIYSANDHFEDYPDIDKTRVKELLNAARKQPAY